MGFLNKQKEKLKNKAKNKVKAKLKTKVMNTLLGVFLFKILPIILSISLLSTVLSWVNELVDGKNNPKKLYSNIESENINEIIAVSKNSSNEYYIGYTEGFDEKIKKTVKDYKKAGYKDINSKLLTKMVQAELYTQYPDFGGEIGKEVSVPQENAEEEVDKNSLENFLFIGDSFTKGFDKNIDEKHHIKAEKDADAKHWLDNIKKLPEKDQVKGVNVFLENDKADNKIEDIKKLLLELHKKYPRVKIFVDKPITNENNNAKISGYINELTSFCGSHDSFLTFIDPTNDVEISSDGINPSEEGYKKLWENIKNKIIENGTGVENEPKLIIGTDTDEGRKGFQGGIKIRRVTPDKEFGKMESVEGDKLEDVVKMSGEYIIEINNYLIKSGTQGKWNIFAKSLKGDKELAMLNSEEKQIAANFIDLFIAEVAYQEKDVDENSIKLMLTENKTEETDKLIDKLGMDKINKCLEDNGYENTEINTKVDSKEEGKENYTSAADVGKLLEKIHNNKFINKETSKKMKDYLKSHNDRKGIPEGITKKDKIEVGNKTGSKDLTQNDAGIIYLEDEPYILVMMGSNLENVELGKEDIKKVSETIYKKITKKEEGENKKNEEFTTKEGTSIRSKVYDMKYIPQEEFDKKIDNKEKDILEYYTLDGDWKLITAKWSYTDDVGLEFQKNSAIDYRKALNKYMTPFEYLMNYYIDIKDDRFIQDFANLIMDSEFIISVQDNVTTTSTHVSVSTVFDDKGKGYDDEGKYDSTKEYDEFEEKVSTNIEVTYADTWFVKFWKDIDYNEHFGNLYHGEYISEKQKSLVEKARGGNVKKPRGKAKEEDWVERVYKEEGYKVNNYCCGASSSEEAKASEHTEKNDIPVGAVVYGDLKKGKKCSKCKEKKAMVGIYVGDGEVASYSARRKRGVVDKLDDWIEDYGWSGWGWLPGTESMLDENIEIEENKEIIMNLNGKVDDIYNPPVSTSEAGESRKKKIVKKAKGNKKEEEKTVIIKSTVTTTTSSHTIGNKYENGESHVSGNEKKFKKLFADNPEALGEIKGRFLLNLIEKNERTAPMLDLTKYLLYCLDNNKFDFGVHEFDFDKYKPDSFSKANGGLYGATIQERVWFALLDAGYSKIAAAAVLGNLQCESNFVTSSVEAGSGDGFGLVQWSNGRRTAIENFAISRGKEPSDEGIQIEFMLAEMNPSGGADGYATYVIVEPTTTAYDGNAYYRSDWEDATDIERATVAFMALFEKPNYSPTINHMEDRKKSAKYYYEMFKDKERPTRGFLDAVDSVAKYLEDNNYTYCATTNVNYTFPIADAPDRKTLSCSSFVQECLLQAGYEQFSGPEKMWARMDSSTALGDLTKQGLDAEIITDMSSLQAGDILHYCSGMYHVVVIYEVNGNNVTIKGVPEVLNANQGFNGKNETVESLKSKNCFAVRIKN